MFCFFFINGEVYRCFFPITDINPADFRRCHIISESLTPALIHSLDVHACNKTMWTSRGAPAARPQHLFVLGSAAAERGGGAPSPDSRRIVYTRLSTGCRALTHAITPEERCDLPFRLISPRGLKSSMEKTAHGAQIKQRNPNGCKCLFFPPLPS